MTNIKIDIEKDLMNLQIKSLFVIEKDDNGLANEALLFGTIKEKNNVYFVSKSVKQNNKWSISDTFETKDFNFAVKKFAEQKKEEIKKNILAFC